MLFFGEAYGLKVRVTDLPRTRPKKSEGKHDEKVV